MTLTEFLLARIAEDEAAATLVESAPPKWTMTVYPHDGERIPVAVEALTPTRVLAECKAHRKIVTEWARFDAMPKDASASRAATWLSLRWVVHTLAEAHANHPDYDPTWTLTNTP